MGKAVCNWVRGVLPAYQDGELKPSTVAAVRRHVAHCESCRAHLRLLEGAWELLDEAGAPPVRGGFTSRMMSRIVEERELERLQIRLRPHRLTRKPLDLACAHLDARRVAVVAHPHLPEPQVAQQCLSAQVFQGRRNRGLDGAFRTAHRRRRVVDAHPPQVSANHGLTLPGRQPTDRRRKSSRIEHSDRLSVGAPGHKIQV